MNQPALFNLKTAPSKPTRKPRQPRDPQLAHLKELTGNGGRRHARPGRCPTCHALTLTGLNDDECAWIVTVDWTPLNAAGEWLALATGHRTYSAIQQDSKVKLVKRNAAQIKQGAKPWQKLDVLPAHICGTHLPAIRTNFTTPKDFLPDPGMPPPF